MSLCSNCISGVCHEGTPKGKIEVINGIRAYVATPTVDHPNDKAVLFMPDAFGIEFLNSQLLADGFARHGFKVYIVDYLNGDAVPVEALHDRNFDIHAWFARHDQRVTRPPLDRLIAGLKEQGVTQFAATGYCWGGRYVFDVAFDKVIKVAAVSHPSLLDIPEDLEAFKETEIPLLINSCEEDDRFPPAAQAKADEILGRGSRSSALYRREDFPGCVHGFAVRGDVSIPAVKAGKEGAFRETVEFFKKHL